VKINSRSDSQNPFHDSVFVCYQHIKIKIDKTVFAFSSGDYEALFFTLQEEHRLNVLENRMLSRIFGPKRKRNKTN
jgi:hypothetical protein